jgi:hypothetical protein
MREICAEDVVDRHIFFKGVHCDVKDTLPSETNKDTESENNTPECPMPAHAIWKAAMDRVQKQDMHDAEESEHERDQHTHGDTLAIDTPEVDLPFTPEKQAISPSHHETVLEEHAQAFERLWQHPSDLNHNHTPSACEEEENEADEEEHVSLPLCDAHRSLQRTIWL